MGRGRVLFLVVIALFLASDSRGRAGGPKIDRELT